MYSSIDRVDIVAEKDGVKLFVQTDHRAPEEMEEEPEISTLFALIRTLLPRRIAEPGAPHRVRYAAQQGASRGVREAVASTGAELESMASGQAEAVPFDGQPTAPADLADRAFAALARRVAAREHLALSPEGLAAFEARVQGTEWDFEDDEEEIERWTAALELSALTGECLRQQYGGRWVVTEDALGPEAEGITAADFGLMPFAFSYGDGQLSNAANKALRAMSEPGQSTLQLLVSMKTEGEAGLTMINLKPADWRTSGVISRPLLERVEDGPNAVICEDRPEAVAYKMVAEVRPHEAAALFEEALANLAKIEVQIESIDVGPDMDLLVVHGDYYASEKILDEAFMSSLHARFDQELLAVAIPNKGRMFVTAGAQKPDNLLRLVALAEKGYANEGNPISPLVFGVMNGKVSAVIRVDGTTEEPPKKKGFWRRLFH